MNIDSMIHPITQQEFNKLLEDSNPKYVEALKHIYYNGDSNLKETCKRYNYAIRSFQRNLKKCGYLYCNIKYGYIALMMGKGFTIREIRKNMGYFVRNDVNNIMFEKIRGDLTPSKKWKILKRDNYRCVTCGSNAADRKLHIDHIIPVSEGGDNNPSNLRVLCSYCNLGRNTDLKIREAQSKSKVTNG